MEITKKYGEEVFMGEEHDFMRVSGLLITDGCLSERAVQLFWWSLFTILNSLKTPVALHIRKKASSYTNVLAHHPAEGNAFSFLLLYFLQQDKLH